MELRIRGSKNECIKIGSIFEKNAAAFNTLSISRLYADRSPSAEYRIYIRLQFKNSAHTSDGDGFVFPVATQCVPVAKGGGK